jgi:hypothetical protein
MKMKHQNIQLELNENEAANIQLELNENEAPKYSIRIDCKRNSKIFN